MYILSFQFNFRFAIVYALLLFVFANLSCHSQRTDEYSMDLTQEILIPKIYTTYPATEVLNIDGIANEASWSSAAWTDYFIDIQGVNLPSYKTRIKMLWDKKYLYIYAELEEPHVSANITQHDAVLFHDNVFELFIDHNDDTYEYVELEINAHNTTWDLYLDRPYRNGGVALNEYVIQELQHAVHIDGKLNDSSGEDKNWSIELAIPLAAIPKSEDKELLVGDYWRMNFTRVQWDQEFIDGKYSRLRDENDELKKPNYSVWSNQGAINMHQPEKWGYVYFADESTAALGLPDNYCDRQIAYAAYRMFRKKPWKEWKKTKIGFTKDFGIIGCADQEYQGTFNKTDKGFELLIENKTEQRSYVINQDGWLEKM